jgi:tRNA threonylcarbamoyladenosine biosynthesis protein TsaB
MLLLVTDTSGKQGSVALARAGESPDASKVEVIGVAPLTGGTFSAQLVPQIASLLAQHGLNKNDISAFVVVSGPGSFTGLRVGLAAIKALAEILKKPIVPVSLLEVVAWHAIFVAGGSEGCAEPKIFPFAIALDAGRGQAFVGEFQFVLPAGSRSGTVVGTRESLLTLPELAELKCAASLQWVASPDAAVLDFLNANLQLRSGVYSVARPDCAAIAWLGWRKLQAGESVAPEQLEANYMRRSDAELFVKQNPGSVHGV